MYPVAADDHRLDTGNGDLSDYRLQITGVYKMAKYNCDGCGIELDQDGDNVLVCSNCPIETDHTATPLLDLQTAETIISEALADAKVFFDEFGEALDPSKTDWDSTAWENAFVRRNVDPADYSLAWELYQNTLVAETERLVAETEQDHQYDTQ